MLVIAGVLLGLVVVTSLIGFHAGPHVHLLAGVLGIAAAVVLALLALQGHGSWVWALFAGDVTVSVLLAFFGWRGRSGRAQLSHDTRVLTQRGSEGVAISELDPEGIVKINGESWSATAVNAPVHPGSLVHVVGGGGVHLEVWGDEAPPNQNVGPDPDRKGRVE